jgi:SAM-dependent methyltransferase
MLGKLTDKLRVKYHIGRYKAIKKLLKNESKELLDIGCGKPADNMPEGSFLNFLGYGSGMDLEERNIKFPFKKGDIMDIPFKDQKFGTVTALEVIEHIDKPLKSLKEVHRILKPGGCYVMSTQNNNLLWRFIWWLWQHVVPGMWNHTHITNYTKEKWIRVIRKQGLFKIEKIETYWHVNLIIKMRKK